MFSSMLERPKKNIRSLTSREISKDLEDFAKSLGIDLNKIDEDKALKIFDEMPSLSEEVKKERSRKRNE